MSASIMPTRLPVRASAIARFTATVVLPTPPFPAPTAMTFFTPGIGALPASGDTAALTCAVIVMSTSVTPASCMTAARACSFICSLTGHAGVVNSIVNATRPPSMLTSFTNPSLTMSLWRSGSLTAVSA